uniref:Uncharacterized protein n=1 Tax=Setaria digitata TaxID=48799 RepID=A0A915PU12_9BILA
MEVKKVFVITQNDFTSSIQIILRPHLEHAFQMTRDDSIRIPSSFLISVYRVVKFRLLEAPHFYHKLWVASKVRDEFEQNK